MKLYDSLERLQGLPLDKSSVFEAYDDLENYIHKKRSIAYPGQIVAVIGEVEEKGVYLIIRDDSEVGELNLLKLSDKTTFEGFETAIENLKSDLSIIKENYASKNELKELKDSIVGIGDLDDKLDTIKEIQEWINEHKDEFEKLLSISTDLEKKISDVNNKFTEKTNEIDSEIEDIKNDVKNNYATKEDLKNFTGVERISSFEFGSELESQSETFKMGSTISEIKILINQPSQSEVNFELVLKEVDDDTIKFKLTQDDIDLSEELEKEEYNENVLEPTSYIFNMAKTLIRDSIVKISSEDFNGCSGQIFIKYY